MNLPTTSDEPEQPADTAQDRPVSGVLRATAGHAWFTLIGVGFFFFEFFFITLYAGDFWFDWDISWFGVPTALFALAVAHLFLTWAESVSGCRFFSPIWKGKPPFIYRKWLTVDDSGFICGTRRIVWEAVDSLALTIWGNLQIFSRSLCGPDAAEPDLVLKFPLGPTAAANQSGFLAALKARKPGAAFNARLEKRKTGKDLRGTTVVQSLGALMMFVILLDVAHSTFHFLQMEKEYYLAEIKARDDETAEARRHFAAAEAIRLHPFPLSWVNAKLLSRGLVAAGVEQERSAALWRLGDRNEAIKAAQAAVKLAPDHYRYNLRLARLLAESGRDPEARAQIRLAVDNHEESFLPPLYMIALIKSKGQPDKVELFYDLYLQKMKDTVFGDEPWWPPGGNRYLHELLYQDDILFIMDRLIRSGSAGSKQSGERSQSDRQGL